MRLGRSCKEGGRGGGRPSSCPEWPLAVHVLPGITPCLWASVSTPVSSCLWTAPLPSFPLQEQADSGSSSEPGSLSSSHVSPLLTPQMLSASLTESTLGSHSVWALPSLPKAVRAHWSLCFWPRPYNSCASQKTKHLLNWSHPSTGQNQRLPISPGVKSRFLPVALPLRSPSWALATKPAPTLLAHTLSLSLRPSAPVVPLPGIYSPPQLSGFCMSHLSPFECYLSGDAPFDHPVPFPSRTFCLLSCFILGTYCRILCSLLTIFHLSPSPPIQKECSRKPELYSSCSLLWLWQLEQSPAHSRCSINTC